MLHHWLLLDKLIKLKPIKNGAFFSKVKKLKTIDNLIISFLYQCLTKINKYFVIIIDMQERNCSCFQLQKGQQCDKLIFGKPVEGNHSRKCPFDSETKQQAFAHLHNYLKTFSFENANLAKSYKRTQFYYFQFKNGFIQALMNKQLSFSQNWNKQYAFLQRKYKQNNKQLKERDQYLYQEGWNKLQQQKQDIVQRSNAIFQQIISIVNGLVDMADNGIYVQKIDILRQYSEIQYTIFTYPVEIQLQLKTKIFDTGTWSLACLYSPESENQKQKTKFQILYLLDRSYENSEKQKALKTAVNFFNQKNGKNRLINGGVLVNTLLEKIQFKNSFHKRLAQALTYENVDFMLFIEYLLELLFTDTKSIFKNKKINFEDLKAQMQKLEISQPELKIVWNVILDVVCKQKEKFENTSARHFFMLLIQQVKNSKTPFEKQYWKRSNYSFKVNDPRSQYSRYKRQERMQKDFQILLQLFEAQKIFQNLNDAYLIQDEVEQKEYESERRRIKELFKQKISVEIQYIQYCFQLYDYDIDDYEVKKIWSQLLDQYERQLVQLQKDKQ